MKLRENSEREVQLNQNSLYACRLSEGYICNISRAAKSIKLKTVGSVELNQKTLCASRLSKRYTCNISSTDEGINQKLTGPSLNFEGILVRVMVKNIIRENVCELILSVISYVKLLQI